ncbi:MAG: zinc ribbon domain-containing protein [Clostridiales bacterium]|nr:zinc ribbon domain-containing protein [Clostridiales bacterium]
MNCSNCGFPLNENDKVCGNCGKEVATSEKTVAEKKPERKLNIKKRSKPQQEKKNTKKVKILICAVAVIVAVLAIVIGVVAKNKKADSTAPVIYIKENSVMVQTMKGENPFVLSDTFIQGGAYQSSTAHMITSDDGKNAFYPYKFDEDYVVTDEKGKFALYPESFDKDENGVANYKLYYRDIENQNSTLNGSDTAKGVLISSSVYGQAKTDKNFKKVAYIKGYDATEGGKLKVSNLKNEIDIDSGVDILDFYISGNGKYVLYTKRNGDNKNLYKCKIKKKNCQPELLQENILNFYILEENNFSVYAYLGADNSLNYVNKKGEVTTVSNDVSEAFVLDDSTLKVKNLYYYLKNEATYLWQEILFDDMLEEDSENTNPTTEQKAEIEKRNAFRKAIENKSMSKTTKALYCFNEESKNKICDNIEEVMLLTDNYVVYKGNDGLDLSNIKMSDMAKYNYDVNTASSKLMEYADTKVKYKTFTGNPLDITEDYAICKFVTVSDDKRFFYLAENCDKDLKVGDLYRFDTKEKTNISNSKIDASVVLEDVTLTKSGVIYYRKNSSSTGSADMYVCTSSKPSLLVESVYKILPAGYESATAITDFNAEKGTLYLCERTKKRKVDSDVLVRDIVYRNGSNLFYIKSISTTDNGSLYWSKNKDSSALVSEYVKNIAE